MSIYLQAARAAIVFLSALLLILGILQVRSSIPFRICYEKDKSGSQLYVFTKVPTFEDMSHENDAKWSAAVAPEGLGFIFVQHNETLVLERGISMFHAMHCLTMIRETLQEKSSTKEPSHSHSHGGAGTDSVHIPHCLSYIAQSILCAGDSTIEPPWLKKDASGHIIAHGVDGVGIEHKCKNTDLLWSTARQSEQAPLEPWAWKPGDTVESVFGH
ncbi:hypothetical protein GGI43DRAFT_206917 [Trichoderma evansii]